MKKKIIALILCMVMLVPVGCGNNGRQQNTDAQESSSVELNVGTWKTAQTIQPFLYGDYIDDKYSVNVMPFTNPGDMKTALLAGSLDMCGTTLVTAIMAEANGEPVKIVCGLCNKCSAVVVGKDSGIETEADLAGKKIAYVPGTMHHILLLDILKRNGLDPNKDVTLVRIDFFDMGQALADGTIDAFCSGEPYPSQAVLNGSGTILEYPYFKEGIGAINAVMITTEDKIKNNPEMIKAAVDAHVKATDMLMNDTDAWIEKSVEFGNDKATLDYAVDNMELFYEIDDEFIEHTKNLAQKMYELGLIDNVPDVEQMFDTSFIDAGK